MYAWLQAVSSGEAVPRLRHADSVIVPAAISHRQRRPLYTLTRSKQRRIKHLFFSLQSVSNSPVDVGPLKLTRLAGGLGFDVGIPYHSQYDYWSDNQTLADSLWESIDTSPMVVALPYTEAFGRGLSWSVPWVWDDDKGVYLIKAFHSIHCLVRTYFDLACEVGTALPFPGLTWCDAQKLVRKAVHDYAYGRPNPVHMFHVNHCLDSLRQDLMCKADDTPMPSINQPHKTGDGQIMECRDWDKLVAWARRGDHHSCFEHINEYKDPVHKLEQFAFCPEGHPSREVMTAYFEKFGHKDAFAP